MNRTIAIVLGVVGTIFLGAIGSGLWERFLSHAVDYLVEASIKIVNLVFTTYTDSIYEEAALGLHESHSLGIVVLFFALLPILYLQLIRRHPIERRERRERGSGRVSDFMGSAKGLILLYALTLTVTMFSLFYLAQISYTNRVITFSLRSIDIVAPYVGPTRTLELRSQYYQIKNTEDFEEFYSEIDGIAEQHKLELPVLDKL